MSMLDVEDPIKPDITPEWYHQESDDDDEPTDSPPGDDGEKKSFDDSELKQAESGGGKKGDDKQAKKEKSSMGLEDGEGENGGLYKPKKNVNGSSKTKKRAAMFGGGGLALLLIMMLVMFMLANLKAIHFATILRSTGFAASQAVMREAFSETAYSDWATQNDTAELPKSKLLDKLKGEDMRKIQKQLNEDGNFKYNVDESGKVTGFDVKGNTVEFDALAKKLGKESFSDLNFRERLSARKYLTDNVKTNMTDVFDMETKGFRNGFWDGFREATGIKMTRFRDLFRDKLGNGEVTEKLNTDESRLSEEYTDITGETSAVDSAIPEVDEGAKAVSGEIAEGAKKGVRIRTKDALDGYLKTKGSDIVAFEEGMSKVSTAVFVTTLYCMGHDLAGTSDRINKQMELSMARFGHQQQTTADQIRSGDVTGGDVSFANSEWGGDKKNDIPDASESPLYKEDAGSKPTNGQGLDNAPRMNISLPFLDWLKPVDDAIRTAASGGLAYLDPTGTIDSITDKAINSACGVVMNPYAQGGLLVADVIVTAITGGIKDLATSGLKAVAFFAGFAGLGQLVQWYIGQIATAGPTGMEQGADRYTTSKISTDYMNSQAARGTTYGRKLSKDESAASKKVALNELKSHYNSGSFTERYFAMSNPYSLAGKAVAYAPTDTSGMETMATTMFTRLAGSLFSIPNMFSGLLGSNSVYASAASEDDLARQNDYFGVDQWGWTQQELEFMRSTNMFDNATEVEQAMDTNPDYYSNLEKCYDSSKLLLDLHDDENCTSEKLGETTALKWRIYKLHSFAVDQQATDGIQKSVGGAIGGGSAATGSCQAGTDEGIQDGYKDNVVQKIRICKVQSVSVNADIAKNVDDMITAAKGEGLTLAGGGFRTMAGQIQARIDNHCPDIYNADPGSCHPPTARPGYSNHQMGLAIDITCNGLGTINLSSRPATKPCWDWLVAHAAQYGLTNLPSENWHWSVGGH